MSASCHCGATPFRKYAESATGGDSHAVCRFTATRMPNQVRSIFSSLMIGSMIGTKMSTIGTHSSGQARRKITAMTTISRSHGESCRSSSARVIVSGVPRRENTAPKKFEAATRNRIRQDTSSVFSTES